MAYVARSASFIVTGIEQIDADNTQWIEVMPTVEKFRNGSAWYATITREDLETAAAVIRSKPGQIPVDYDHAETSSGTKAAGWFTGEAEIRDASDGSSRLWAKVKWTKMAREEIEDGQWKRISPEWTFAHRDRKTGLLTKIADFLAATLTNRPAFDQLAAVTARELLESDELDELGALYGSDVSDLLVAALGGDVDAVRAAVWTAAYINDLPDSAFLYIEAGGSRDADGKTKPRRLRHFPYRSAEGAVDLPHLRNALSRIPQSNLPAEVKARLTRKARRILSNQGGSSASTEGDTMSDELKVIATNLGLSEDATEDEIAEAAKAAQDKTAELEQKVSELEAKVTASAEEKTELEKLREEVKSERTLRIENEREQMLAKAIEERRIVPAQKEALAKQFGENLDGLREVIAASPAGTFTARSSGESGDGDGDGDEATLKAARARLAYRASDAGEFEADDDSLKLHVAAEKILAEAGKKPGQYTEAEYRDALFAARGIAA